MSKREEFNKTLKEAMKNKDEVALSTVRLILAALKDRDISAREKGNTEGINDDEILSMLQTLIKQRNESAETYENAGRIDLAKREREEIAVIERFMPAQLSDEDVSAAIDQIIKDQGAKDIKDMGKVMGQLKSQYAGQIDMGKASGLVKSKLG